MKNNIPQEEPKQEYEYIGKCNGNNDNGCFLDSCGHDCGCFERVLKQSKKETLEEAAERIFREPYRKNLTLEEITIDGKDAVNCMLSLADWQKHQDKNKYSDEDLRTAYFSGIKTTGEGWNGEYANGNNPSIEEEFQEEFQEWFEQFKKK